MGAGWHNSTKVLRDNVDAFFQNKEITLDLITDLCNNRVKAKKEMDKARGNNKGLHSSSKSKIKHMSCCEDFGFKEMLLIHALELYFSKTNLLIPAPNERKVAF